MGYRIQDLGTLGKHQTKKKSLVYQQGLRVQNSGPWDPWLPMVENSRLFAQRGHSAGTAHGAPPHSVQSIAKFHNHKDVVLVQSTVKPKIKWHVEYSLAFHAHDTSTGGSKYTANGHWEMVTCTPRGR